MAGDRLLTFGSYTFPAGFRAEEESAPRSLPSMKLPRADGARMLPGTLDRRIVVVRGSLIKGPMSSTAIRTTLDALRAALSTGPQNLTIYDDRYFRNAQTEGDKDSIPPTGFNRMVDLEIPFIIGDPFQYANTASTDTWTIASSGLTHTVTAGGNAYARTKFSITVGGSGPQTINFTVANTTTGESFTLIGSVTGGNVIDVDTLTQTVQIAGVDKILLFDGRWPTLAVGANVFSETYVSGSITQIVASWNNRYW